MTETIHCPDCGYWSRGGSERCEQCNHPLGDRVPARRAVVTVPPAEPGAAPVIIRRPIRSRPPRSADSQISLQLWLIFGTFGVAVLLWVAIQSNVKRAFLPVEGSTQEQQQHVNALVEELARDSNSVAVHRQLADVLYDTANWSEAIVHYRAAIRRDSTLVTAMVDLGVCYFNLGQVAEAERHFLLALVRDPNQSVALFNLGIVSEGRSESEQALKYYHRALQAGPPASMTEVLNKRITELMQKLGRQAPPLPSGK